MRYRRRPSLDYEYIKIDERVHLLERVIQAIGFTPDFPYTLNVNDGTRNRVLIGRINGDYGIKIVDNTGAEVILANGTIVADAIKTGTLDADRIAVGSLPGIVIGDGTLGAEKLIAGTITATSACIASLNAGWITVGGMHGDRIQEGTLHANKIQANTISAGQISASTIITQSIQIGNNIVGTGHITSITGSKIEVGTLDANRIVAGTITTDRLVARSITTDRIAIGAVNYGEIANGAVHNIHIHDLSADKITAGTITANRISGGTLAGTFTVTTGAYIHFNNGGDLRSRIGNTVEVANCLLFRLDYGVDGYFLGALAVNLGLEVGGVVGFHSDLYMNNHSIWQCYGIQGAGAGGKLELNSNINMLNHNIDACNKIWLHEAIGWYCNTYEDDPFIALKTIKPKTGSKNKKNWGKLDHTKLHKSLVLEDDEGKKGMNMLSLIMVQNKAIVEMSERLERLEARL